MAERRQALRFPFPYFILVNSQFHTSHPIRRSLLSTACRPRIDLACLRAKLSDKRQGLARQSFFHQPRSDCTVFILLRCTLIILFRRTIFISIVSRENWSRPPGSATPHLVEDKLMSAFLRQWISVGEGVSLPRPRIQPVHGTVPQKCVRNTLPARSSVLYRPAIEGLRCHPLPTSSTRAPEVTPN
jgi:hypothetical protein